MISKGFTLVELMMVMAILAILAGVAITQYASYKNKIKAKDLITLAGACVQEILAHCVTDGNFSDPAALENCRTRNGTMWLDTISFTADPPFSSFSCNRTFAVTASAKIKGTDITYRATCIYDVSKEDISCSGPKEAP